MQHENILLWAQLYSIASLLVLILGKPKRGCILVKRGATGTQVPLYNSVIANFRDAEQW